MIKKRAIPRRSECPINIALELFGDSWSLLIVRDLMFKGRRTFNEFLSAEEKIASNILSDRLLKLEAAGILTKAPDRQDARRFIYRLTEKGIDLAPVMTEIVVWSATHEETGAPPGTVRQMRLHRARFVASVRKQWSSG